MRLKILVLALVASLVAVSAAVAKDHPGKGPKPKMGAGCKPAATVMLAGTLAAEVDPQDGDTSFVLTVKRSNRHGRAYRQAGTATILVDAKTRVRRENGRLWRFSDPRSIVWALPTIQRSPRLALQPVHSLFLAVPRRRPPVRIPNSPHSF